MTRLTTQIDGPVAVIGDVHGHADKLAEVLEKLRTLPDYERRWIVLIGDFVDRGPDPKGVLDLVTELLHTHRKTTAIAGNHEFAMASALDLVPCPDFANWKQDWVAHYESETTFDSYDVAHGNLGQLANQLPDAHRTLLAALPWCVEHPRYLFVHAGLETHSPFEMQRAVLHQKDFTLGRPPWLCAKWSTDAEVPHDCPFTVVSGHVHVPQVKFAKKRIFIDTNEGDAGELSAVLLPEKKVVTSGNAPVSTADQSWWKIW